MVGQRQGTGVSEAAICGYKRPKNQKGSPLVANLNRASSVQIALRLPAPDLAKAREIAGRKGIGYQTLLKMLVHEGLRREARRG